MRSLSVTPFQDTLTLSTGAWNQATDYRNWRPRGTRDHLLIYTQSGAGRVENIEKTVDTGPGGWLMYRPDTPQAYRTADRPGSWSLLWAHVHPLPTWKPLLDWPEVGPGVHLFHLDDATTRSEVESTLHAMVQYDASPGPFNPSLAMNALEKALLLTSAVRRDRRADPVDVRLREVIDRLHQQYDQPWSIDELARVAHLSASRFAHLFREQLGTTPLRYLEGLRIQRAQQLLEQTGLSVGQVAAAVGFEDAFYFSRRFRAATSRSPRAFRQHANTLAR